MPDEFLLEASWPSTFPRWRPCRASWRRPSAGTGVKRTNLEIGLEDGQAKTQLSDLQKQSPRWARR